MTNTINVYQVDAFAEAVFRGNPAAVCPLDAWLGDDVMQAIAVENNLSETAFVVPDASGEADYGLRWFTPKAEIELCGHATLASAWVLFNALGFDGDAIRFSTLSGILTVRRREGDEGDEGDGGELVMDFPITKAMPAPHPDELARALNGPQAMEYLRAKNDMRVAVLGSAAEVRALKPDLHTVYTLGSHGLIVTAPGGEGEDGDVDFVSRFFVPQMGISEDPVTGSAHTVLAPYWARRLKKEKLRARQVSARGGNIGCEMVGERVHLSGRAVLYLKGEVYL